MPGTARTLNPAERLDWLRLIRSENVGPVPFYQLLARFGSAEAALAALPEIARRGGRARPLSLCPRAVAEREMQQLHAAAGRFLAWGEPDYPAALAALDDAPPLISVKGDTKLFERNAVAVVGARNASANGRRFARDLALQLGQHGLLVVSGLARGIDAAAHEGALATGTVAVLAGGIDQVYPEENRALHEQIAERGVLIAELPVGTEPQARHFPRRNRIISGCSLGVIVVEAALRSGSLITARFALEQGRDVFAVPGSPLDPRCRGANDLIRNGAILVETVDDVMRELQPRLGATLGERKREAYAPAESTAPAESELARVRARLVELLSPTPVPVDELVRQCQLSPALVVTILLELELAGRIERHPGNQVSLL
ncbi:MAG TPA: DNA-processing protein DprA [Stellaceae bacterium]|nr:DNA-processing protein DprA [Stellaceae bacterium]